MRICSLCGVGARWACLSSRRGEVTLSESRLPTEARDSDPRQPKWSSHMSRRKLRQAAGDIISSLPSYRLRSRRMGEFGANSPPQPPHRQYFCLAGMRCALTCPCFAILQYQCLKKRCYIASNFKSSIITRKLLTVAEAGVEGGRL